MVYTHLFLHMGPGGNAQLEHLVFSNRYPFVDFWDQGKIEDDLAAFATLTDRVIERLNALFGQAGPIHIIAHSFGGLLLERVLRQVAPEKISGVTLLATGFDYSNSFSNLLAQIAVQPDISMELSEKIKMFLEEPVDRSIEDHFWQSVNLVMQYPNFLKLYFANTDTFNSLIGTFSQVSPIDFTTFTAVSNAYLKEDPKPIKSSYSGQVEVYLGEQDPLLNVSLEARYWQIIFPQAVVHRLPDCGHFCHLERNSLFLNERPDK
jgi:pimeloyl-ACP methyl ester carboxylesterase